MQTADFTISDVLAWARTKPADEAYVYTDSSGCALCQFLNETGRAKCALVDPDGWSDGPLTRFTAIPPELNKAVQGCGVFDLPERVKWSFGALVKRLEALCHDTAVTPNEWTQLDAYLTDIEDVARERCSA